MEPNYRQRLDIRASHVEEMSQARAERLREATKFAKLLGYRRITWTTLHKLGYDIEALGYRPQI